MVTFTEAKDVLKARLEAVFGGIGEIAPGTQAPEVREGFPVNEPPFYVAVDEIVDSASTSGAASMGHAKISFTLHVWCFARHVSQKTASDTLLAYVWMVILSVLADHTLGGTVDNSFPSVENAGTAADSSRYYTAAASVAIECTVFSQCPSALMEAVKASNPS